MPSIVEELADLVDSDESRWIHVRCMCGFIVMGPRRWVGRTGRCPHCGVRVMLALDADVAMHPDEVFLMEADESEAVFAPFDTSPEGGVALAVQQAEKTQLETAHEAQPMEDRRGHEERTESRALQALRDSVAHSNRWMKGLALAALFAVTTTVWIPLASGTTFVRWIARVGDRLTVHDPPKMSLEEAVKTNDIEQVKANLASGASAGVVDANGLGILSAACIRGDARAVTLLIEGGANVNETDRMGTTPLHWAAGSGRIDVVQYLVEHGAGISTADRQGNTPLREAAFFGKQAVVEFLQSRDATM